jgi:antitoxin component HigA of HigAB toxin-antitoxin module
LSDVNANIGINFDTQQALASLRQLQAGLSRFNQSLTQGNIAAENAQKGLNAQLMQSINATGKFVASQKVVAGSTSAFTTALEKNQLSMGEYFRFTAAAATANTKVFSKMFAHERDIFNRARKDRVKSLQTQYIQLTSANGELVKVLQVVPKHLQMVNGKYADYATRTQMAAQRQQMMNQLLKQGSTQLLNFGKNTQWAGRQLMVGLTVPLTMLGGFASKVFREMEQSVIAFTRVYGDMTTSGDATNKAIADIQRLAKEFTKYGIAAKDTIEMAAKAAAMGLTGNDLNAQVISATRLAVLGQVEQQQALETTISLQNAFGISSEQLAEKINFLNAVENQTVLSIEDLTIAVPKAGPVIKQLGGSVEDLAFFMTAMKEGGINASEGANALKSGLASMINPSKKAAGFLADLGINIKGLVEANAGNLKGTVIGFAKALDTLDPLNRARAIEQMFGKFQFARLSTLFQNVTKDSSQAARALGLAGASVEELAILSERELGKVEDAVGVKFQKSIEQLKLELIPIGKTFLQALTPVVEFLGKILAKFNNFSDGTKKAFAIIIGVVGGLAPVALMTFGLFMNAIANGIKLFAALRSGMAKLNGQNNVLGGGFDYLTQQEIEQLAQTNALHTSHQQLISTFNVESGAVNALAAAYANAASQARTLAASSPGLFNTVPGPVGAVAGLPPVQKFAKGGVVPGTGNKDTVPSMLTPGEVVLTTDTVKKNPELVAALLTGTVKKYGTSTQSEGGGMKPPKLGIASVTEMMSMGIDDFAAEIGKLGKGASQATAIAEVKLELTKATDRAGEDMANAIKRMLAEAAQSVEKVSADWVKNRAKDINPETGEQWRAPYANTSSTPWQPSDPARAQVEPGGRYVAAHMEAPKPKITDKAELERLAVLAGKSGLGEALALAAKHGGSATPMGSFTAMLPEEANKTTALNLSDPNDVAIHSQLAARRGLAPAQFSGDDAKVFEMPKSGIQDLFSGEDAGKSLSPVMREIARLHGKTFEQGLNDPAIMSEMTAGVDKFGGFIAEEMDQLPDKFGEEDFYAAVQRAKDRLTQADGKLKEAVDNLGLTTTYSVTTNAPKEDGSRDRRANRKDVPQKAPALRDELGLTDAGVATTTPKGKTKVIPFGSYQKKNTDNLDSGDIIDQQREKDNAPTVEATPEEIAAAEAAGAEIGKAAADGVRSTEGTDADSPSKKGIKAGKEVADGIIQGMKEGEAAVTTQASQLGDAAVPTAAETQARVDRMDLGNKAFYDDLNTPEMRDERQILKSQDRQRRKLGATATVDSVSDTPVSAQTSSVTVASSKRVAEATTKLAVKTEEAVTAQSQVVQQIKDESRSRVTIKGNTVNIQKAREDADKAENEAAITRARAAALEKEQAKQKKTGSPTTITDEQVLAAKEKANAAELEYARVRQELAEQGITAAQPGEMQEIINQDPVKTPSKVKKAEEIMSNGTVEAGDGMRRIVDGTNDTADSTLLVADQTGDLADATGEAFITQTGSNQNLLTASQLASVTAGNLGDVANATDLTGNAQQDVLESTQAIDEQNRKIEEHKRMQLKVMQEEFARREAIANAPVIPEGTQSGNPVLGPNPMDRLEAYDYAMGRDPGTYGPDDLGEQGFTRDRKGRIVMDPEKDAKGKYNPTKMSLKQVKEKKRGMRRAAVGQFSGKVSGGLGTAAMVAGMAGAPPQVTAALGTAATVAQFAPMIAGTGPIGLAVGAVVALGAAAYLVNKHFNQVAAKAAQFAKDLSATRDGLKAIGEMSGKVGSSQKMDKRRSKTQYTKYTDAVKIDNTFGKNYMASDIGKKEKKLFKENMEKFGKSKAVSDLTLKLATAVADGVIDADQANSIAAGLALQLKDTSIEMQVVGQLSMILGPDGKNLKDNPMSTRILLMGKANQRTAKLEKDISKKSGFGESSREEVAQLAALGMNNMEMATMMADQIQVEYEAAKQKLETELASTANAQKKLEIEQQLSDLNSENLKNSQFMNDQIFSQIMKNQQSFDKVWSGSVWGKQAMREDAFFDASRSQVTSTYKGTDQEDAAKKFLNKTEALSNDTTTGKYNSKTGEYVKTGLGTAQNAQRFQAKMEMLVGSKVLTPTQATSYMDLFSGKLNEFDFLLNASIKTKGTAKTKELFDSFAGFKSTKGRQQATNIITEMTMRKKDPKEFDAIMETIRSLQALDGNTIDFEILITKVGMKGLQKIRKEQEAIEKIKEAAEKEGKKSLVSKDATGKETVDPRVAGVSADISEGIAALQKNEKRFTAFKNASTAAQADYLQALSANILWESTANAAERDADIAFMAEQYALDQAMTHNFSTTSQRYIDLVAQKIADLKALSPTEYAVEKTGISWNPGVTYTSPPPTTSKGPGTGSDPLDFLDELAMRIKNVRDGAFDATKPLQSMIAAFTSKKAKKDVSAMFDMFDGLQHRLLKLKVPQEMRDVISGMSSEEFTKFSNLGKGKNLFTYDKYTSGPNKGKEKPKTKKNIKGLTNEGKAVMATYREANVGASQLVNKETVVNVNEQKKAMNMLMSAGLSAKDALAAVEDQLVASAIANGAMGESGTKEFKEYKKAIVEANSALERQAILQNLTQKNADFKFSVQAQDFAKAFADAGLSIEQINEVLEDPQLTGQLIDDLKNGRVAAEHIRDYINSIPKRLEVSLTTKINSGDLKGGAEPGLEIVDQMFSIQEALIRAGAADAASAANVKIIEENEKLIEQEEAKLRALQETQVVRESLAGVLKGTAAGAFEGTKMNYQDLQDAAKAMSDQIEVAQRDLEMNAEYGSRAIDDLNESVNDLNRDMEMNKDWGSRAVQALQDESGVLSHDLDLINKAAEGVNEKYDKQAEALQKVQQINQNILALQQDQLDLAGALTSGDISSAAKAAQKMRATAAGQFASGQTDALEQARKNSIDSLKSGSGMTSKQIQDRQYEIAEKIYKMETHPDKLKTQKQIQETQDKIYTLEEKRKLKMDEIQKIEDAIYLVNKELAKDDGAIDKINRKLTSYNTALSDAQKAIDKQVAEITVMGTDKKGWDLVKTKLEAYDLAKNWESVKTKLAGLLASTTAMEKDWGNIHNWLDQFMKMPADKKVNINVITKYTYEGTPPPGADNVTLDGCPEGMVADANGWCVNVHKVLPSGTPNSSGTPTPSPSKTASPTPTTTTSPKPSTTSTPTKSTTSTPTSSGTPTPTPTGPKVGDTKYVGSMLMTWNGTMWMDQVAYNNAKVAPKVGETKYVGSDLMTWNGSQWVTQVAYNAKKIADQKAKDLAEKVAAEQAKNRALVAALEAKAALIPKSRTKPGTGTYLGGMFIPPVTQYLQPGTGVVVNGVLRDPVYKYSGGLIGMTPRGSDTVPAMLTPGEFIMSKYAVDNFGVNNLKAINSGSTSVGGDSVYNYNLTVNAKSNASPDDIARTVMAQIQQIDSQRIRGVRI